MGRTLSGVLENDIAVFSAVFSNDDTLITRRFENRFDKKLKYCLFFIDGMVNNDLCSKNIVAPLMRDDAGAGKNAFDTAVAGIIRANDVKKEPDTDKLIAALLYGDTVLIAEGSDEGAIISTKGWIMRSVAEPPSEIVLRGPREGFTEAIMPNLSMLRRRIGAAGLKLKFRRAGTKTQTRVCLAYIEGIAEDSLIREIESRLDKLDFESVLDSNYIAEAVRDRKYSPFKTIGTTERPDVVAAKLLEGRAAVFVDGSPVVLTAPHLFIEYFQSNDDYYMNYWLTSFSRMIRMLAALIAVGISPLYLSLVAFHRELLPIDLLTTIYASKQGVPFSSLGEILLMTISFEILREAGARAPSSFGQVISIFGAIILGQASVEAKIISAPVVIIVSMTGITGLMTPRLKSAIIFFRFFFLLMAATLGIFGFIAALTAAAAHIARLESFGSPYASLPSGARGFGDIFVRSPWFMMDTKRLFKGSAKK